MLKLGKIFWLILLSYFFASNALAADPFRSDDPDSLDKNQGEFYLFSGYNKVESDVGIGMPGVELNYGIIDDVEFDARMIYLFNYPHVIGEPNTSGLTDTQLELKYRLIHETPTHPQLAIAPIYYMPAGNFNRNLGNGRPWFQLPLWLQKSFGAWTTYGGGGYTFDSAPTMKNYAYGGWVLQKQINDHWILGGEIFSSGAASQILKSYTLMDVGGYYFFNKNFCLLGSIGHSVIGQENLMGYFGMRWDF